MLVVISLMLVSLFLNGSCLKLTPATENLYHNEPELKCITNITRQYFGEAKSLVYLNSNIGSNLLLKLLHSMEIISFNSGKLNIVHPHLAYLVVFKDVPALVKENVIANLVNEANWNPDARFLVAFKSLKTEELRAVFDIFLQYRARNVVVLNGSITEELYTYNPYENFACGNYYSRIISYGKCSEVTADIYPEKATTGLKNCFFNVSVAHWLPWSIDPRKMEGSPSDVMGTEQYIFHLISEIEQFSYRFVVDYEAEEFTTVSQNLTISGPMNRLQKNLTNFMLGGLFLIPSRAQLFSYINGHLDYTDEIRVIVKKAEVVPAFRSYFTEFSLGVWALIALSFILYLVLLAILLKTKDKGQLILMLLDSLLSHGVFKFRCRQSVKCVILTWIIFAYFVNSFYTTTLMSLTTQPVMGYQINNEESVIHFQLKPCISLVMGQYMQSEHNHGEILKDVEVGTEGCVSLIDSVKTVSNSFHRFTIVIYSIFSINSHRFCDKYQQHSLVHSFKSPYTKVIYAIYFNKGLPLRQKLYSLAIRIREAGLPDRHLKHQYFNQTLYMDRKLHDFETPKYKAYFIIPWPIYIVGLCISTITFFVELASQYNKVQVRPKYP